MKDITFDDKVHKRVSTRVWVNGLTLEDLVKVANTYIENHEDYCFDMTIDLVDDEIVFSHATTKSQHELNAEVDLLNRQKALRLQAFTQLKKEFDPE